MRLVERALVLLSSLALSFGLIALLSGFFQRRDTGPLAGGPEVPGQHFRDLGDALLRPGELRPPYDSTPPTSGPHFLRAVTQDLSPLNDDQLLTALALGDVVVLYRSRRPASSLLRLASSLADPFTPALAATGQAVVLSRLAGLRGLVALAWAHMLRVRWPGDPRLARFVNYWLGRGAPATDQGP